MDQSVLTFKALGDPTRQKIISILSQGEKTISEVADHFDITRAGVKKHLKILEEGRLIQVRPVGRERLNRLNQDGFDLVAEWHSYFDQFWDVKLSSLKRAIEQGENNE